MKVTEIHRFSHLIVMWTFSRTNVNLWYALLLLSVHEYIFFSVLYVPKSLMEKSIVHAWILGRGYRCVLLGCRWSVCVCLSHTDQHVCGRIHTLSLSLQYTWHGHGTTTTVFTWVIVEMQLVHLSLFYSAFHAPQSTNADSYKAIRRDGISYISKLARSLGTAVRSDVRCSKLVKVLDKAQV